MNRGEMVTRLGRLVRQVAPDSGANDLAADLNDALHELDTVNPSLWTWSYRDLSLTTVADQGAYTWDELARLLEVNEDVDPADPVLYPLARIQDGELHVDGITMPLASRGRHELKEAFAFASPGTPEAWTAEGETLYLYPTPDTTYDLLFRVLIAEADLTADDQVPLLPARYHGPVLIQLARAYVYDRVQDTNSATSARNVYESRVRRMMASSRPRGGAGRAYSERA